MSSSHKHGPTRVIPQRHMREQLAFPARTPGVLGINDASDPTRFSLLGDTPGPLGFNDHGSPGRLVLPGLRTFHARVNEASVRLPPPPTDNKIVKTEDLTRNFSWNQFACKDGTPVPSQYRQNIKILAKNLQVLRDRVGQTITIHSAYRTESYNKKVGGEPNSQHMLGKAADIAVLTKNPRELHNLIEELILKGEMQQGGLGLYPTFVHYDVRGVKARWIGGKTSNPSPPNSNAVGRK